MTETNRSVTWSGQHSPTQLKAGDKAEMQKEEIDSVVMLTGEETRFWDINI